MWLSMLGCGGPLFQQDTTGPGDDPEDITPSEYVTDAEAIEPTLTLAEIEEGITEGLQWLYDFKPELVHQSYKEVMSGVGETCPYFLDGYDYDYWSDTCQSTSGTNFSGFGQSWSNNEYVSGDYTYYLDDYFNGDARITTADGNTWVGSGYNHALRYEHVPTGYRYIYRYVRGEFSWDGLSGQDSWLDERYSIDFYMGAYNYPVTDDPSRVYTYLNGGLSGLTGLVNTISLREVMIYSSLLGSVCDLEPHGSISVRDAEGSWYDVVFDGPAYWGGWSFEAACDGCGTAYFRGEPMGDACVDFSSWLEWESLPW